MNIKDLNNLTRNNNKIIEAIDSGKKINIEKSIRACLISNNRIATIMAENSIQYEKNYKTADDYINESSDLKNLENILFGKGFSK